MSQVFVSFSLPILSSVPSVLLLVISIVATLAVVLRLWARKIQKVRLELNDYMIMLGLVGVLSPFVFFAFWHKSGICISWCYHIHFHWRFVTFGRDEYRKFVYQTHHGGASPSPQYNKTKLNSTQLNFIIPLLWITAVTLIRFSVILLYIRIFATRSFRLSCYVILILNITFFIATFLSYVLSAIPVGCHWSDTIDCSSTLDAKSIDLPVAVFNLLLDVTVVVLPMPVLWGLQMAVGKKATLSGMFGLGFT